MFAYFKFLWYTNNRDRVYLLLIILVSLPLTNMRYINGWVESLPLTHMRYINGGFESTPHFMMRAFLFLSITFIVFYIQ